MQFVIHGVGVDIVKVSRFKKYVNAPESRFVQRVYTQNERDYLSGKKAESFAGIFAAKEAVAKALGTGFAGFFPIDIEIIHDTAGKPRVYLHGKASEVARGKVVHVSISHTSDDAVGFAVL